MPNRSLPSLFRPLDAAAIIRLACKRPIVVVAPHPDDETLGCGLLIARIAKAGLPLVVIVLTDGQASHPGSKRWSPKALGRLRRAEMRRALARLGAKAAQPFFLGWPDGDVAQSGHARDLRRVLSITNPGVVLAASPADHHPDHKAGWEFARSALSHTRIPLVAYSVWSRTGERGAVARDPAKSAKNWAIAAHRSQTSDYISDEPKGFRLSRATIAALVGEVELFGRFQARAHRASTSADKSVAMYNR